MPLEHSSSTFRSYAIEAALKEFPSASMGTDNSLIRTKKTQFKLSKIGRRSGKSPLFDATLRFKSKPEELKLLLENFKLKPTRASHSLVLAKPRKMSPDVRYASHRTSPSVQENAVLKMLETKNLSLDSSALGLEPRVVIDRQHKKKRNKQFIVQLPRVKKAKAPHN